MRLASIEARISSGVRVGMARCVRSGCEDCTVSLIRLASSIAICGVGGAAALERARREEAGERAEQEEDRRRR